MNDAVARLLAAIESRDLRRVADALTPDATWQNVPHAPAVGRDGVVALLAGIVCWADEVRWDVVSTASDGDTVWCERNDRFVIAGDEHAVRCNGVFRIDLASGRVAEVRDYVDLAEWRERIAPAMAAMAARPAREVVARHLEAVASRDVVAMAADYALDAVLVRGAERYEGWAAIADYFDTVPDRLGANELHLDHVDDIEVRWQIPGIASGRDTYEVRNGRITHQVVALDQRDF